MKLKDLLSQQTYHVNGPKLLFFIHIQIGDNANALCVTPLYQVARRCRRHGVRRKRVRHVIRQDNVL